MDMGTLQHNPSEFHQVLSYQADLKKLPHLSAKISAKFYQIVCIGRRCPDRRGVNAS
jgi:hypothetical protein